MIPNLILLGLVLCLGVLAVQVLMHAHLGERLHVRGHAHRNAPRHVRR